MTRPRSSLTFQSLFLAGSTALAQILFAVLITVTARHAGPEDFGVTASALSVGGFLTGVLDYGFTSYSLRELAAGRMDEIEYWARLRAKLLVGLVGVASLVAVGLVLLQPGQTVLVGLAMLCRTLVSGVGVPLQARHHVGRVAVVVLAEKLCWLAAFALLVQTLSVDPIAAFWWSMPVGAAVAALLGLITAGGMVPFLGRARLRSPWTGEAGYGTYSLAVSLSTLDVAVLSAMGGSAQAGAYGALARWTQPVQLLSQTFSRAATPFIAGARTSRAAFALIRRSLWIPALALASCLSMAVLAPLMVPLLLGAGYQDSVPALVFLAVGAAAVVANQSMATFLQVRGHARYLGAATIGTVLLQLSGVALTAGWLGAQGAALAYGITQFLLTLLLAAKVMLTASASHRAIRRLASAPRLGIDALTPTSVGGQPDRVTQHGSAQLSPSPAMPAPTAGSRE